MVSVKKYQKYQIGQNLQCIVELRYNDFGMWINPSIYSFTGYGDMYNDASDFVCLGTSDDLISWDSEYLIPWDMQPNPSISTQFIYFDLNFNTLGGSNITSIASNMFFAAAINTLILPTSVVSIGDHAFDAAVDYSSWVGIIPLLNSQTLVLPASLTNIGAFAFSYLNFAGIDFRSSQLKLIDFGVNSPFIAHVSDPEDRSTFLHTNIYLGDPSLEDLGFWYSNKRIPTYIYGQSYEYRCYDSVNGDQVFPLYETQPAEQYFKVYNIFENGQPKTLYLPLVPVSDTTNGGNRVQFIPGVGTYRFKK